MPSDAQGVALGVGVARGTLSLALGAALISERVANATTQRGNAQITAKRIRMIRFSMRPPNEPSIKNSPDRVEHNLLILLQKSTVTESR